MVTTPSDGEHVLRAGAQPGQRRRRLRAPIGVAGRQEIARACAVAGQTRHFDGEATLRQ